MKLLSKIYVCGHNGLVGSAVMKCLKQNGYVNLVYRTSRELDLRSQDQVNRFFEFEKPEYVFLCAGKVGGIQANINNKAEFIYDNMMIQSNVIHAAYKNNVTKLLALGSSCIYPRFAPQPMKEEYLLSGELEPTNEPYAIAKISALKMCDAYRSQYGCNFISAMPTNLYGENDNYDLENSHVLPALIRKMLTAKANNKDLVVWGTGMVRREFLFSEDAADGCLFLMKNYDQAGHINLGTGTDIQINELVAIIADILRFDGKIIYDTSKPDGMMQKLLDITKAKNLGWQAKTSLRDGIKKTIDSL